MRVRDEQLVDEVLTLDLGSGAPAPAPTLRLIAVKALRFGIAAVRDRHDDILFRDQILNRQFVLELDDLGAPVVAVAFTHLRELAANHGHQLVGVREDLSKFFNFN